MNTIYALTSSKFPGAVELEYDPDGYLIRYINRAEMTTEQLRYFLSRFPITFGDLEKVKGGSKTLRISKIEKEVSFDEFWDKYDHKAVSSKKKSRAAWDRLTRTDQALAFSYISRYFAYLPGGVSKKYAETYLNSYIWRN